MRVEHPGSLAGAPGRSSYTLASALVVAAWRSGAAHVPVPPGYPPIRVRPGGGAYPLGTLVLAQYGKTAP